MGAPFQLPRTCETCKFAIRILSATTYKVVLSDYTAPATTQCLTVADGGRLKYLPIVPITYIGTLG